MDEPGEHEDRLNVVLAEYLVRVDRGERVDRATFVAAHAEFANELGAYFDDGDAVVEALTETGHRGADTVELPSVLGDYELMEELGRGGMGAVYRARHRRLARTVAVKVLPHDRMLHPEALARFEREMAAVGSVDHPNIVRAHDAREVEGTHFLVMEYVEGLDLARRVRQDGPMAVGEACDVVRQAAVGLAHLHRAGLVHRDIKPSNLMLTLEGQVKILDMGLARLREGLDGPDDLTSEFHVLGTADYLAPEQALDAHRADARSDIYSLGCTLHFLLVGRPPYGGGSGPQKMLAHREEPIPSLRADRSDVCDGLDRLFHRMLAKRPEDRPQSMTEVIAELDQCLAPASGTCLAEAAGPATRWSRVRSLGQRRSVRIGVAVGLAAIVLLGGVILRWQTRSGTVVVELREPQLSVQFLNDRGEPRVDRPAPRSPLIGPQGNWSLPAGAPAPAIAPFDAKQAREHQAAWAKFLAVPVETINSIGMKFTLIPPGEFDMGSSDEEIAHRQSDFMTMDPFHTPALDSFYKLRLSYERPRHRVRITRAFFFGATEVRVRDFSEFVKATGYQTVAEVNGRGSDGINVAEQKVDSVKREYHWRNVGYAQTGDHPVANLAWVDAKAFCEWLSKQDGMEYRLPTEAEWEYACRAGTTTRFYSGDHFESVLDYAWCGNNSQLTAHPVATKRPNAWGLYDMHGSVSEYCNDYFAPRYDQRAVADDPQGPSQGTQRVFRSHSWMGGCAHHASAGRWGVAETYVDFNKGVRVALSLGESTKTAVGQQHGRAPDRSGSAPPASPDARPAAAGPGKGNGAAPHAAIAPFDARKAREQQEAWARSLGVEVEATNSIGMKFTLIPPGEFDMGATDEEAAWTIKLNDRYPLQRLSLEGLKQEQPRHRVRIRQPFRLGVFEVTQAEYQSVIGWNPAAFSPAQRDKTLFVPPLEEQDLRLRAEIAPQVAAKNTGRHPVETVSWSDAVEFCRRLSSLPEERAAGRSYRLPTEGEWEYACRAGTEAPRWFGSEEPLLAEHAWFAENSRNMTQPVGRKKPNPFGLHDMYGNVWEWCSDWMADNFYRRSPATDPQGPATGDVRVTRGGAWDNFPSHLRSSHRSSSRPEHRNRSTGFRVVCEGWAKP